tara:strand:+ start:572 stop:835 length:264 start_codon:yes stop_codon:yes gene_type:complete
MLIIINDININIERRLEINKIVGFYIKDKIFYIVDENKKVFFIKLKDKRTINAIKLKKEVILNQTDNELTNIIKREKIKEIDENIIK